MARIQVHGDATLSEPTLIEGLPGAGLVGKIAADHLVRAFDMEYYAAVHCDGLPRVAVYGGNSSDVRPPVRLYADASSDLLVLQSDVPVSPSQAAGFAGCITGWIDEMDALPLYLSGLPEEKGDTPEMYGIATGGADRLLEEAGIVQPRQDGMISGPTGALLYRAAETNLDAVGLIVQTDPQFPDPEGARALLKHGIEPIAGVEIDTKELIEKAGEIQAAREQLAEQLQGAGDERSEAQPIRGFQ
ncbi:MAG: PAC2 family protein [Natronomonas sp.]